MTMRPILALCILIGCATTATAQDYGQSGDWTIKVNPDNGNGCFMQKAFETGTLIQVGFVPDREGAFFAAYNPDWTTIIEGETSDLLFDFGDSRFMGEVMGAMLDDVPGGYAYFDNPEFASEFGRRQTVTLEGARGHTEAFDLAGSARAITAVKECQTSQE